MIRLLRKFADEQIFAIHHEMEARMSEADHAENVGAILAYREMLEKLDDLEHASVDAHLDEPDDHDEPKLKLADVEDPWRTPGD